MRQWLAETHGPTFELYRHFLVRFLDSDLVTAPGQTALALIGASSMFLTWFPFVTGPIKDKYQHLAALNNPTLYREALRADQLWLIVMMMSVVGLLTVIKWQSLFPTLADYRVIGWLPVKARQVFAAKLLAMLTAATAAILVLNLLPAAGFPALSRSPFVPLAAAMVSACYFVFFALVALRGMLRIGGVVQALAAAVFLILLMLSFSIGPSFANWAIRPEHARWLPPVWFLPSHRAPVALYAAIASMLAVYSVNYRRHRALTVEGGGSAAQAARHSWILILLTPDPRQQAIVAFLAKGLFGNGPHRMVLMGYAGFGLAVGLLLDRGHQMAEYFVSGHIVLLTFLLIGVRHLFSIPVELRANWLFQISERDGRRSWQSAVDRFVFVTLLLALFAAPLPVELRLLGSRTLPEMALTASFGLLCYEGIFSSWEKLPFTCSYLPGKTPMWMLGLRLLALLAALPFVNAFFVAALFDWRLSALWFAGFAVARTRLYRSRRQTWTETRLIYDEAPDPAVRALNLLR